MWRNLLKKWEKSVKNQILKMKNQQKFVPVEVNLVFSGDRNFDIQSDRRAFPINSVINREKP